MITFHALVLFASYLAFFAAVVTGVSFLVQEGKIKRKDPDVVRIGAVPLELLDRVNLYCVVAGFALFSFVGCQHFAQLSGLARLCLALD